MVERSIPEDKKVKTVAGNKIWWSQVGGDRYLYPGAIKVLGLGTEKFGGLNDLYGLKIGRTGSAQMNFIQKVVRRIP